MNCEQVRAIAAVFQVHARARWRHAEASLNQLIGDERAYDNHGGQAEQEQAVSHAFEPVPCRLARGTQGKIGEQAGEEENDGVNSNEIVRDTCNFPGPAEEPEQPDNGQAYTYQASGHGKDMTAKVSFVSGRSVELGEESRFSGHGSGDRGGRRTNTIWQI